MNTNEKWESKLEIKFITKTSDGTIDKTVNSIEDVPEGADILKFGAIFPQVNLKAGICNDGICYIEQIKGENKRYLISPYLEDTSTNAYYPIADKCFVDGKKVVRKDIVFPKFFSSPVYDDKSDGKDKIVIGTEIGYKTDVRIDDLIIPVTASFTFVNDSCVKTSIQFNSFELDKNNQVLTGHTNTIDLTEMDKYLDTYEFYFGAED